MGWGSQGFCEGLLLFVFSEKAEKEWVSAPRTATSFVVWGSHSETGKICPGVRILLPSVTPKNLI